MLGLGKIALALKGSLIGGKLDALLTSPSISTADLPVALPLTKPVLFKDIRILAKAPYPLKQSVSALELADVTDLGLTVVTGNSSMNVKGTVLDGHAKVTLTSLSVSTADLPVETGFKKPVDLKNLEVNANVIGQAAQISNLSFQLFNGQVKADGGLVMESSAPPFRGKFTIHDLQVSPVLQALNPDSVVSLSGTAALALAVAGRGFSMPDLTRSLEGPGRLEVKDGKIEGVNLVQEAMALLKVAGIQVDQGKATAFSSIETDVLIKQGAVRVQKFLMDGHEFQATGSGTVGFDQTLNLAVNLSLRQDLSRKIAGSSSLIKLALKDGRLTVPLRITGSAQNPSYGLDMRWLTGIVQEQAQEKVKEAVGGLLKGTTKPEDLKQQGRDLIKGLFGR